LQNVTDKTLTCDPEIRDRIGPFLSALTVIFGPQIVTRVKSLFQVHPSLAVLLVIGVLALGYLLFRLLRGPTREMAIEMKHKGE
jgi:hypothetical protein